jgi:hypothetical protein
VAVVQAPVVVDGLGCQHGGQVFGQCLHAVEGAVAADADQPLDVQGLQAIDHRVDV